MEQPVTSLASIFIIPIAYLTLILVIAFTINIMDKLGKDIECEKKVKMKDVLTRTQILSFPGYLINFTPGRILWQAHLTQGFTLCPPKSSFCCYHIYLDYDNVTRMCYIEFSKICGVAILFKSPSGFALGTIAILISFQLFRKLEAGERNVSVNYPRVTWNPGSKVYIYGQFRSRGSFSDAETMKEIDVCQKLNINGALMEGYSCFIYSLE